MSQYTKRKEGIDKKYILRPTSVLEWKKSRNTVGSSLYKNLQGSLSPVDYYFDGNTTLFKKNDKAYNRKIFELFENHVVIDKEKIPANFLKLFTIDRNDEDIENQVREIFSRKRFLNTPTARKSARVNFIDDKIIIFRSWTTLAHQNTQDRKLTPAEKKRTVLHTTFNTYSNIYDAIRSQEYTIQGSQEKQKEYKTLQTKMMDIISAIEYDLLGEKDDTIKRKVQNIKEEVTSAKNAKIMHASVHRLEKIMYTHKGNDQKRLVGAKNDLSKRFKELQAIVGNVAQDLEAMEQILSEYKSNFEYFLAVYKINPEIALDTYHKSYNKIYKNYGDISPFCHFHKIISESSKDEYFQQKILKLEEIFKAFNTEHEKKLNGEKYGIPGFDTFKDNLKLIDTIITD